MAEAVGFDLCWSRGRLGLQHTPGMLSRAIGIRITSMIKNKTGTRRRYLPCFWKRYRVLIEKRLGGYTACSGGAI